MIVKTTPSDMIITDNAPGSLVLGGFDQGASEGSGISISNVANLALTVNARSIVLSNTLQGTVSVTHELHSFSTLASPSSLR
jgi:hypothetical protein